MIEGVKVTSLKVIPDERGKIKHMLRSDSDLFKGFGEIYFSFIYPGVVKGWHLHDKMMLNYAVPVGNIKFVLYDARDKSSTKNELMELFIGEDNYSLVTVPPGIWNGFKCVGVKTAVVANFTDIPHDPNEIHRLDPINSVIPYKWDIVMK
jgi:dTDP-4-dehydrorhamnose 3,5-epimerase